MVGTQMNVFGVLLGYLLPFFFVDSYTEGDVITDAQRESYKNQVFYMFLTVAIFALTVATLAIFTFRERPGALLWSSASEKTSPEIGTKDEV